MSPEQMQAAWNALSPAEQDYYRRQYTAQQNAHREMPVYYQPPAGYQLVPAQMAMPVARQKVNGSAIASLVCGLLWLGGIGSLIAIFAGHGALREIKRRDETGEGMAIAGLILGYIGLLVAVAYFFV